MASELGVRDLGDALLIKVRPRHSLGIGIVLAVVSGGIVAIALRSLLELPALIAVAGLAAALAFLRGVLYKRATLRVTNLEFQSRGSLGDSFHTSRTIPRANVLWLEYQTNDGGPGTYSRPAGLYAVLDKGHSVCILPPMSEQRLAELTERMVAKFPELRKQFEGQPAFGRYYTPQKSSEAP